MEITRAQEEAVKGIRSAFATRRVMVENKPEWGVVVAKTNGETFLVFPDGRIEKEAK